MSNSYLRGVQLSDSMGELTFLTIYPGRYSGRATHFHLRIYRNEDLTETLATTQLAFSDDLTQSLYKTQTPYQQSMSNRYVSNEQDFAFRDKLDKQLLHCEGNADDGYVANIEIAV